MKIYLATFSPCVFESYRKTISAHKTEEGAQKAIDEHKSTNKDRHAEWVVEAMDVLGLDKPVATSLAKKKTSPGMRKAIISVISAIDRHVNGNSPDKAEWKRIRNTLSGYKDYAPILSDETKGTQ